MKPMYAGFANRCITPPVGTPMEGLLQNQISEAIHDDLFVRVLALQQGDEEVLIVSFDLLFFERPVVDRFKGALGRRFGLIPAQVLLNTTHTHAGPRMTRWEYGGAPDPLYLDDLEAAMCEAVGEARTSRKPVILEAGVTKTSLPVSRRKPDAVGRVHWKPFRKGAIYDELPFCVLKGEGGAVVSVLFSVACHPSMIYEYVISAEYPGVAIRHLNEHFGTEGALFLQGAAGDTKPRHVADGEERWRAGTWEEMEDAGREVAAAVIEAARAGLRPVRPDLKISLTEVAWLLAPVPTRRQLEQVLGEERQSRVLWAEDMIQQLERRGGLAGQVPLCLHFLQLGQGLRLIGVEGEVLAKLGVRIREIYDQGVTFVLGYTNGTQIYLPVTEEIPEGGYEVDSFWEYHHPAPPAPGCEEPLLQAIRAQRDSGAFLNVP